MPKVINLKAGDKGVYINQLPEYITATISSERVFNIREVINLDVIMSQNGKHLSLSQGGIKIGPHISKVEVSGQIFYWKSTNTDPYQWASIRLNDKEISTAIADNSGDWAGLSFTPRIIDVKEGDVIYLYNICTGRVRQGTNTYLHVKVAEYS